MLRPIYQTYDLAIAYRVYPKVSRAKPPVHAEDKLALATLCLRSFKAGLGKLRVKVHALLDSCPDEYEVLFRSLFSPDELVIHRFHPALGNYGSFARQIDLLLAQEDSEIIYLAEDDYLYLPDSLPDAVAHLRRHGTRDFVTPHLSSRPEDASIGKQERHWSQQISTMLTFMTTKTTLARFQGVFRRYDPVCNDFCVWLAATKSGAMNPVYLLHWKRHHPECFTSAKRAWKHLWKQLLVGPRARLWEPYPTLGTHMVGGLLSAGMDWPAEIQRQQERLAARKSGANDAHDGTTGLRS